MNQIPNIEEEKTGVEEEVEELIDALGVTEHRAIGFVKVIPTHSLRQLLIGHHHQLQKARQDWLREEIVRLEGMKILGLYSQIQNNILQTIIDRYHSELDQDKV